MLSNPLKKALAEAIHQFNEYQFAKYKAAKSEVKLKDAIRIIHPRPLNQAESELFKRIIEEKLVIPETWEVYISTHGSTKNTWETIMPKMPIMATLRNLRNFCKVGVDIDPVIKKLTDERTILNSKQFPFRFWSAYKALEAAIASDEVKSKEDARRLIDAIHTAMEISVKNLPHIPGITFMAADNSGSMHSTLSAKGTVSHAEVADLLQAMAHRICDESITSVFGESFAVVPVNKTAPIIKNMKKFFTTDVGHSTNGFLAFKYLLDNQIKVDRILLFSDMQLYTSSGYYDESDVAELWRLYKKTINRNAKFYSFDLTGYGTLKVPEKETYLIAGFSEKVLDFIKQNETSGITAVEKIDRYKPLKRRTKLDTTKDNEVTDN